jgi:RNA polymerase sigma-70 factor (ECF subfamily)
MQGRLLQTDAELLAAAGRDPDAFVTFYDRYEQAVAGYLVRRVGSPEEAADLTAEVFAKVLAASPRYRPRGETAAAWMFTIARNTLRTSIRRGRVDDAARRKLSAQPVHLSDETVARLTEAEGDRWVQQLLVGLPEREREAIEQRVLRERPYAEIANALALSELVVRKRVSRGLSRLRAEIERPR